MFIWINIYELYLYTSSLCRPLWHFIYFMADLLQSRGSHSCNPRRTSNKQDDGDEQPMHTVSLDWFLSGLEWILNLEICLLKLLIFYQKLLWNIRSRLNSSTFWVFEPLFKYVWSKSSFFVHKASILIKHIWIQA